ncbi:unnamed protein product [Schistosoma mattheei]|uniref:Uncharacterized protein n=1 Tax=Schistosoma mattheei TaxID=31246 RepID=A0A3P8G683_9TREM|nr:unnamed protein product [Schistosoma mattheei]
MLVKLVINSSQPLCNVATLINTSNVNKLPHPIRTDLDESMDQCTDESENNLLNKPKNIITQLVLSYHEYISQAFCWPKLDTLRQWLQDGESYSNMQANSFDDHCYMKQTQSVNYDWNAVLILEMRFLCLLHDNLGGMKHPLVYSLIQNFCMDNASQLEFFVNYWCSSLYNNNNNSNNNNNNTSINEQHLMSPLPITSVLIQQGILSTDRIQLAETILKLYWRILVAAEYISTSGLPIIASNILYSNHSRIANLNSHIPWPSYGPTVHSEFFNTVFNLIQCQIHCCSILFQRHGFKSFKSVSFSGSHITPTKSGITGQSSSSPSGILTSTLPKTTLMMSKSNEIVTSSHSVSSVSMESSGSEISGLKFLYLIRHLIMSLSVLMVQLPILGKASLMTSDELKYLNVHVHLTFNSPNLNDNSTVLTFGVLITLANSLGSLSSKEACHSFGISLRRTSVGHPITNTFLPRSPSSRSSSTHLRLSSASPQTPASSSILQVSAPDSRSVLTFVLKILALVLVDNCSESQMFLSCKYAALALPIRAFTSASDPSFSSMMLPKYVEVFTSSKFPSIVIGLVHAVLK